MAGSSSTSDYLTPDGERVARCEGAGGEGRVVALPRSHPPDARDSVAAYVGGKQRGRGGGG
eukprot:scaffold97603_cov33-Tisochrysis_lutea.AAC.1